MNTNRREFLSLLSLASAGAATTALAQDKPAPTRRKELPPVISPEVHSDRTVTFRLRAPKVSEVLISGEWGGGNKPLTRDKDGVWSVTLGPFEPELYGYSFVVDGLRILDPSNTAVKPMRSSTTSILDLPGNPPLLHDWQDVPHGVIHQHQYISKATKKLRRMHVYTPPGYGKKSREKFPVIYLFHGSGDNDATWTVLGRAHWIMENLLAQKKCKPAIMVMTDGHPVERKTDADRWRNVEVFEQDLLESVMPLVESTYAIKKDADSRAIVGLSMGGQQSLVIGLKNTDKFAWVGGMSSAVREPDTTIGPILKKAGTINHRLKLLWFAVGLDDKLINENRKFSVLLDERGIRHSYTETPGNHSWPVWRKYLAVFLPLLFKR